MKGDRNGTWEPSEAGPLHRLPSIAGNCYQEEIRQVLTSRSEVASLSRNRFQRQS